MRFLAGAGLRRNARARRPTRCSPLLRDGHGARGGSPSSLPSVERSRETLETVFAGFEIPPRRRVAVRFARYPSPGTPLALAASVRAGAAAGGASSMPSCARPYSGIPRPERRLRRGAPQGPRRRTPPSASRRRPSGSARRRSWHSASCATQTSPLEGVRDRARIDDPRRLRLRDAAHRRSGSGSTSRRTAPRQTSSTSSTCLEELGTPLAPRDVIDAFLRLEVRGAPTASPGRVAVLDLLRARTRRFETVFLLGLEEGSLPRRGRSSPFLDDDAAARARRTARAPRSREPRPVPLLHRLHARHAAGCTSSREAATDDGSPLEASPFWDDVAAVFGPEDVGARPQRRPLSQLTWPIDDARRPSASGSARWPGSRQAPTRPTSRRRSRRRTGGRAGSTRAPECVHARRRGSATRRVLAQLRRSAPCSARPSSSASPTAPRRGSSSASSTRRRSTRRSDALLRGKVAHQALYALLRGAAEGARRRPRHAPRTLDAGARFLERCLRRCARGGRPARAGRGRRRRAAREPPARPRAASCAHEARVDARAPAAAVRGRLRHGPLGAGAPARAPTRRRAVRSAARSTGSTSTPCSARGIVQDYKSGKGSFSARADRRASGGFRSRSTCSCCATSSGSSRSAASTARSPGARGGAGHAPRRAARDDLPGFQRPTTTSTREAFWAQVETARERALGAAQPDPARRRAPTTRRAASARRGATSGRCAGWRRVVNAAAAQRRSRRAGEVFVSAGAGTGKTTVLVERFVARRLRRRARRRLGARHHLHAQGAPASCARASARRCARAAAHDLRAASSTARGSRRSTASARGCCGRTRSRSGSTRASASSTTSRARVIRGEAFEPRARGVLRRAATERGCGCSPRTAARGCGGC